MIRNWQRFHHRFHWQVLALLLLLLPVITVMADEDVDEEDDGPHTLLTEVEDLAALGAVARESGVPILLMFASEDCHYCERLEAEVLGPMKLAGDDPDMVLLRKVMLETSRSLRDFNGNEIRVDELARLKNVGMVPTLFLLDADGQVLVPKMVGYTSPDFYPAYLEQAIAVARRLLQQPVAP